MQATKHAVLTVPSLTEARRLPLLRTPCLRPRRVKVTLQPVMRPRQVMPQTVIGLLQTYKGPRQTVIGLLQTYKGSRQTVIGLRQPLPFSSHP